MSAKEPVLSVNEAIIRVMRELDAIAKNKTVSSGGGGPSYKFRGIEDMYNEFHPKMADAGIYCVPRVVKREEEIFANQGGKRTVRVILHVEYDLVALDGSKVTFGPFVGEGNDTSDKASNKAMSGAHKYFFIQTFVVATEDEKDPDQERVEIDNHSKSTKPKSTSSIKPQGIVSGVALMAQSKSPIMPTGKFKGKSFDEISQEDLVAARNWCAERKGAAKTKDIQNLQKQIEAYLSGEPAK